MDVGIYLFPQYLLKESINEILEYFANVGINRLHLSFNENYLLNNSTVEDFLFFKPNESYYQPNLKSLHYSPIYSNIVKKLLDNTNIADFKIIAWLNCLQNKKIITDFPEWAQINHLGTKDDTFLCPNNINVQKYISNLIKNIINEFPIHGIELFNTKFLFSSGKGISCFCKSCQKEAIKPNALEDLKEREIIDEKKKGINLKSIQKYVTQKFNIINSTINQDLVFQTWNQFRYNSNTRFVGKILVDTRLLDQNVSVGVDVWPISEAELIGQNYADLATYQDYIYQILFMDSNNQKYKKITNQISELKNLIAKARGVKKFYACIDINEPMQKINFLNLINDLQDIGVEGIVLYYFNRKNKSKLEYIREL